MKCMDIRWGGSYDYGEILRNQSIQILPLIFEVEEWLWGKQSNCHHGPSKEKIWICCKATP